VFLAVANEINTDARTLEVSNKNRTRNRITKLFICGFMACAISSNVGCFLPIYDADPAARARQLIHTSEDLRSLRDEWHRFWFLDQPSHMQPLRTHGGIL
jgi:hypothetical protein